MCGICGIVNGRGQAADKSLLKKANDSIAHRGPDDEGFFFDGPVGLAMRRLAISFSGRQHVEAGAYRRDAQELAVRFATLGTLLLDFRQAREYRFHPSLKPVFLRRATR